jgi:hypothetical protein
LFEFSGRLAPWDVSSEIKISGQADRVILEDSEVKLLKQKMAFWFCLLIQLSEHVWLFFCFVSRNTLFENLII